jgi:hypothetical protein
MQGSVTVGSTGGITALKKLNTCYFLFLRHDLKASLDYSKYLGWDGIE